MTDAQTVFPPLDDFLASVELRAYVMARLATRDGDAALDIVQDSMFRMVRHYANRPSEQWRPLFYKVLNNRITDYHRKRGFDRLIRWFGDLKDDDQAGPDAVDQLSSSLGAPDEQLENEQLGEELTAALMQLSERQRQAFMLRQWQGMSVAETATAMGVSAGSVKTHLSRAMQALQLNLQEYRTNV